MECYGPNKCQYCGAKTDMLLNVHLRVVEGVHMSWQVGAGKWHCGSDDDDFEPLRGGHGHPYDRDEDSD